MLRIPGSSCWSPRWYAAFTILRSREGPPLGDRAGNAPARAAAGSGRLSISGESEHYSGVVHLFTEFGLEVGAADLASGSWSTVSQVLRELARASTAAGRIPSGQGLKPVSRRKERS